MRTAIFCLILLALAGVSPSLAGGALEPPELGRFLRWGPLRVRPGIEITNLGYDSNIFATNSDEVGDYVATLAPRVDGLVLFGHKAFLVFREQPEYTVYLDHSDQNFFNNRFRGRLIVPFSRFGLFSEIVLDRVRERPADQEDIRPLRDERRLSFGTILELGWRTEIELSYEFGDWAYSDPDFSSNGQSIDELLDRDQRIWRLRAGYRVLGRTRLTLDVERATIDFDDLFISGGVVTDKDSDALRTFVGAEFADGGPLSGKFRVGWAEIDVNDPVLTDFEDVVGEFELGYRLNSRTRVELEGERLPAFAVYRGQTYLLNTNYGLRGIRFLNRIVGVEAGFRLGELEFPEKIAEIKRQDDTTSYDAGVRLRLAETSLGRRVEYRLRLVRTERDSNIDGFDRNGNRVAVDVVIGY